MPTATQLPGTGTTSLTSTANSRRPSAARALTSARSSTKAPEHQALRPRNTQPSFVRSASTRAEGGSAAHTPQSPSGAGASRSARIATASQCASARRPRTKSTAESSASACQRCNVRPEPGSGRSSTPTRNAARSSSPTEALVTGNRTPASQADKGTHTRATSRAVGGRPPTGVGACAARRRLVRQTTRVTDAFAARTSSSA
jgi:hypothetical protein